MDPSVPAVTNTREAFRAALNPPEPPKVKGRAQEWGKKFLYSPYGQSMIGGLVTVLVLYFLNPPFVQSKNNDSDIEGKTRDSRKILVWTGIVMVLILVVPWGYRMWKKHNATPEAR